MEPQWGGEKSLTAAEKDHTLTDRVCAFKTSWAECRDQKRCRHRANGGDFSLDIHSYRTFTLIGRFCDEQSGHSFYPLHCYPGSLARSWRRPFHSCGVSYRQAPTLDRESLPATIAESMHLGPHPRRLDSALGTSHSPAPFRNRSEAFDTAWHWPSQSLEQAKVPRAVLPESPSEARPERTQCRTHPCGSRNEAT